MWILHSKVKCLGLNSDLNLYISGATVQQTTECYGQVVGTAALDLGGLRFKSDSGDQLS
jgi:ethanolamine utilization protein EutA (predicted chaperonin)